MVNLISPEHNLELFCYRVLDREPKTPLEVLDAASMEITSARGLHHEKTKRIGFRRGSRGAKYCNDLQRLISIVMNGTLPSDTPPDFIAIIRPLVRFLLQSWNIGDLRKHFA